MNRMATLQTPPHTKPQSASREGLFQRRYTYRNPTIADSKYEEYGNDQQPPWERAALSPRERDMQKEPPVAHEVLRSHGQPLDQHPRMEPSFRHDFSQVRVHTEPHTTEWQGMGAAADTAANPVAFAKKTMGNGMTNVRIPKAEDPAEPSAGRAAQEALRTPEPAKRFADLREPTISYSPRPTIEPFYPRHDQEIRRQLLTATQEPLQTQTPPGQLPKVTPDLQLRLGSLQSTGNFLPRSERAFFEPRFGSDFGNVRIHTGSEAADLAHRFQARAFTLGRSVVFGAGQYTPGTLAGRELLGHELTHVAQNQNVRPAFNSPSLLASSVRVGSVDSPWEREAEAVARRVTRGLPAQLGGGTGFQSAGSAAHVPLLQRTSLETSGSLASNANADVPVLPWKDTISDAVVFATSVDGDGIRFSYPERLVDHFFKNTEFTNEFQSLGGDIVGRGIVFNANQRVKVHDHEYDEVLTLTAAEAAKKFGNKKVFNFGIRVGQTAVLAGSVPAFGARLGVFRATRIGAGAAETAAKGGATALDRFLARPAVQALGNFVKRPVVNTGLNVTLSVAPNLISQINAYGAEFDRYNKRAIAFDVVLALVGGKVANAFTKEFPLDIRKAGGLGLIDNVTQFSAQQTLFYLYGLLTSYGKVLIGKSNTKQSSQDDAAKVEFLYSAAKSLAGQAIFLTPFGQRWFPDRFKSFSWQVIDKTLSIPFKLFLNDYFGVVPKASESTTTPASTNASSDNFGTQRGP